MASRFQSVHFDDFNGEELRKVWEKNASDVGWDTKADASNVAARRVARGMGSKGFAHTFSHTHTHWAVKGSAMRAR